MALKAQYLFDDAPGSGTVVDSVAGHNGTRAGDSTLDGCSLTVTGHTGSTFKSSTNAALSSMAAAGSLMAWISWPLSESALLRDYTGIPEPFGHGSGWMLVGRRDGGTLLDEIEYRVGGTAVHTGLSLSFLETRLRHYAITWDGAGSKLYIDGALVYSGPAPGASPINLPWTYGQNGEITTDFFAGRIADMRLYDDVVSGATIAALAAAGSPCDPPLVDFSGTPRSGDVPLVVDFTDLSIGATSWLWHFGDGATSTAEDPTHTYTVDGVYTVSLTGTNANGDTTETKVAYIVAGVPDPVGWDVYAAAAPDGPLLASLVSTESRSIRMELNGAGKGVFTINRNAPEATAAILAKGNLVKVRIPELGADYLFAFFLEDGDFELLGDAEEGAQILSFSGRGALSYLDRARMWSTAYTTGLDISDTWTKVWQSGAVTNPAGIAVDPADSTYVWIIREDTRRIYKVRQSDRVVVSISPVLFSGYAGGLSLDPSDATIFWALEAPWLSGSSAHTKIHKIRRSDYANLATFDLGAAVQHSDIRAGGTYLWLSRYDGTVSLYKRSKVDGSVVNSYTVTYNGVTQTRMNGVSVNGTKLALWYQGTSRALISSEAAPTTVTSKISTTSISSFGGEWTTESAQDYFYMVSYTVDQTWKYQVTAATPHDPVDGIWRLDEGTPGAILARLMAEWQAAGRPQQPLPDATYGFDFVNDSNGDPWATNDGTLEFNANIGDLGMATVLRLVPYGIVVQMSPSLVLGGYNSFGTDRSSGAFGAGKVRLVAGVNIGEELKRRLDSREVDTHMLAKGDGGLYATATEADLGYVREGFVSTQLKDASALAGTAVATLSAERVTADSIAFVVEWGDDEATGLYLPTVHYGLGDVVRVHTGTGPFDFDETDWIVYAITLEEQENGTWRAVGEFGAGFLVSGSSSSSSSSSAGGGSGAVATAISVTVRDTVSGDSYSGTTLEGDFGVSQPSDGVVEIIVRGADATIEVQENGTDVLAAATGLDLGHGLDGSDETGGVAGVAVDETELDGTLIPNTDAGRGAVAIPYTFSTTTTDSDPGNGVLRLSNASQSAAVTIRADLLDALGIDVTALLDSLSNVVSTTKGYARLQHAKDPSKWLVATIAAIATPGGGGYRNITIANIAKSATSPFSNGDGIVLILESSTLGHHAAHEPGGADAMAVDAAAGTGSLRTLGTGATQAAAGNDTRFGTAGAVTHAQKAAANIAALRLFR